MTNKTYIPLAESVTVMLEKEEVDKTTESGLILTEKKVTDTDRGIVMNSGPECKSGLVQGDVVLFMKGSQGVININRELGIYIMNEARILCKVVS